jgi:hypothetical protein
MVRTEAPKMSAEIEGKSSAEIRQYGIELQERLARAVEVGEVAPVVEAEALIKIFEAKSRLALAFAEEKEAHQAVEAMAKQSDATQAGMPALQQAAQLAEAELRRETARLEAIYKDAGKASSDATAQWHRERSEVDRLQKIARVKAIAHESLETGVPCEVIAARNQEEQHDPWLEDVLARGGRLAEPHEMIASPGFKEYGCQGPGGKRRVAFVPVGSHTPPAGHKVEMNLGGIHAEVKVTPGG